MKIGIFMPGRLNSQRFKNKLIAPINNTCLWDIACKKLNELPEKYNKYVLVNEKELISIAKKYPNIQIILRHPQTSNVDGPLTFIFKDIEQCQDTHLMFLNPCLYFLKPETILNALKYFEENNYNYLTSVKPFQNWLFDKKGFPLNNINYKTLSTKDITPVFQAAHAFHIFNRKKFFNDGLMLKKGHGIYSISYTESLDVDTKEDFELIKAIIS